MNPQQKLIPASNITAMMIMAETEILATSAFYIQNEKKAVVNIFPVDVFPACQQEAIESLYNDLNYPKEFTAAGMLYAASIAIGNTYRVQVKNGWIESASIYIALVGRPGANKTHPLSFAIQPIEEYDRKTFKEYEQLRKQYDKAITLTKKEREENNMDEPVRPMWKKHLLTDYTPEALAEVHKYNKRGIAVYTDEMAGWFKNFNKYNKGSETEFWLSAFSGRPIAIDRKTTEPTYISQPFISVAGTIQNGLLQEMAKDRTQNGFIDRILFVCPDNMKKPYFTDTELSPAVMQCWHNIISRLLCKEVALDDNNCVRSEVLCFSPIARAIFIRWQEINADKCNDADTEAQAGVYSKLEIYIIRLALILQMLYWAAGEAENTEISKKAILGAVKLIEYFRRSADKVHAIISNPDDPLLKLTADKRALYDALPGLFSSKLAVETGSNINIPERTVYRFITGHEELFRKLSRGEYEKII